MTKKYALQVLILSVLLFLSISCGLLPGKDEVETLLEDQPIEEIKEQVEEMIEEQVEEVLEEQAVEEPKGEYDTVFPLPPDVQNFMGEGGESQVNFQTNLSLEEVIEFYRDEFTMQGLTERGINTSITEEAFSMVFDGSPNGQELVIQGVDLGETTNVNMRFEDL